MIVSYWTRKDHEFIELLRTMTVYEASKQMKFSPGYGYNKLRAMREKISKSRNTVNIAENWRKEPRIRKLLTEGGIPKDE